VTPVGPAYTVDPAQPGSILTLLASHTELVWVSDGAPDLFGPPLCPCLDSQTGAWPDPEGGEHGQLPRGSRGLDAAPGATAKGFYPARATARRVGRTPAAATSMPMARSQYAIAYPPTRSARNDPAQGARAEAPMVQPLRTPLRAP